MAFLCSTSPLALIFICDIGTKLSTGASSLDDDAVELTRMCRVSQGSADIEQNDFLRLYSSCDKNPNHENYISVDMFKLQHLPEDFHGQDLVDLVKTISHLTVHVSVKLASIQRPKTYPNSDTPFPNKSSRKGTGLVFKMAKNANVRTRSKKNLCKCKECLSSNNPKARFAEICIITAAHVVFDEPEGEKTTCCLFFDSGDSPERCLEVIQLSGMSQVKSDIDTDVCKMTYFTHDTNLIEKLDQTLNKLRSQEGNLKIQYECIPLTEIFSSNQGSQTSTSQIPVIIVSHPHGYCKKISVGNCICWDKDRSIIKYTTATCPGCSGAPVLFIGSLGTGRLIHLRGDNINGNSGRIVVDTEDD